MVPSIDEDHVEVAQMDANSGEVFCYVSMRRSDTLAELISEMEKPGCDGVRMVAVGICVTVMDDKDDGKKDDDQNDDGKKDDDQKKDDDSSDDDKKKDDDSSDDDEKTDDATEEDDKRTAQHTTQPHNTAHTAQHSHTAAQHKHTHRTAQTRP